MRRRFSGFGKRLFGWKRSQRRNNKQGSVLRHAIFARLLRSETLEDRRMLNGLTLITHGWNSGVDAWVDQMANEIRSRVPDVPGTNSLDWLTAEYTLEIQGSSPEDITGYLLYLGSDGSPADAMEVTSGEVLIKLDWSALDTQSESASFVGDYVAKEPRQNNLTIFLVSVIRRPCRMQPPFNGLNLGTLPWLL